VYTYLELLTMQILGEMVRDRGKLGSVLDSGPQKSVNLAKIFKKILTTVKMQACVIKLDYLKTISLLRKLTHIKK
jgi:hypothetical protein